MEFKQLELPGVFLIKPKIFGDQRGFFKEVYNKREFEKNGIKIDFVQDNYSRSTGKHILRGLHYQKSPHSQAKLVRVVKGKVLDVAVDLRKDSLAFGQHVAVELSEENHRMLLIPEGFAHGFLTLSEVVDFEYKASDFYHPESERGLRWNDPDLGIDWAGTQSPQLIERDQDWPNLKEILKEELF